ncbi:MAG: hypothetical protein U0822_18985 [Anaerolineae bacterium]
MEQAALLPFSPWESFYVIIGSASAALIGLQFVVIVLSADLNVIGSSSATSVFGTPTIVHFCAALFIAAIVTAPWPSLSLATITLGIAGILELGYAVIVVERARRQRDYEPVLEDWIFHAVLPITAYTALVVAAVLLQRYPTPSLFVTGGVTLLLLFIGIHNAWDSVIYIAQRRRQQQETTLDREIT